MEFLFAHHMAVELLGREFSPHGVFQHVCVFAALGFVARRPRLTGPGCSGAKALASGTPDRGSGSDRNRGETEIGANGVRRR